MSRQGRQRDDFVIELEKFIDALGEIDKSTPWQPQEPEWWLELKAVEKQCLISRRAIKDMYHV